MPFNGFTPFLATIITFYFKQEVVCQCPLTGLLHFYCKKTDFINQIKVCQCPSTGLHHFYGVIRLQKYVISPCVNALQRAYIISTTATATANMTTPQVCQCPSTGLHHFYGKDARCCSKCEYVSMPFNGLTSFLQFMRSCS